MDMKHKVFRSPEVHRYMLNAHMAHIRILSVPDNNNCESYAFQVLRAQDCNFLNLGLNLIQKLSQKSSHSTATV